MYSNRFVSRVILKYIHALMFQSKMWLKGIPIQKKKKPHESQLYCRLPARQSLLQSVAIVLTEEYKCAKF